MLFRIVILSKPAKLMLKSHDAVKLCTLKICSHINLA
jgi:hypothetical protein